MANSNAQHTGPTSHPTTTPEKEGVLKLILKFSATSIIIPILVAVIVTQLNSPASIGVSNAHAFLTDYFNDVTNSAQRVSLYREDLTVNFRNYPWVRWEPYSSFWAGEKNVTVDSVIPVPGNPSEFAITVTYQPAGNPFVDDLNFWLVCSGVAGKLETHIPDRGCPLHDIRIDNEQVVQHNE